MSKRDDDFQPQLGKARRSRAGRGTHNMLSLERRVMRAVGKAGGNPKRLNSRNIKGPRTGRYNARGRGAKVMRTLQRDKGWKFNAASGQRMRMRRVIVKARYVKLKGRQSRAGYAHLRYLQRDGVSREGEPGKLYGRGLDVPESRGFLDRGAEDPHQFRIIVAPEDGVALGDLKGFTRDLVEQMERDLETRLDWVAVDHHNTGHPHTHIIIRGVTDDGKTLNIAGDYIAHGIRHRASEILTRELGLQSEQEVEQQLDHEVGQERFTRLDRDLIARIGEDDRIDMRPSEDMASGHDPQRYRLLKRLTKLEGLGLAQESEPGRWILYADIDDTLKELGERGDIIKTMHRTLADRGLERGMERYVVHREYDHSRVAIGRVIGKGLAADEMSDRVHLVVDAIDGRVHYAEMAGAQAEGVRIGAIVDIGRAVARTRESDRTIAELAARRHGVYEPVVHKFAVEKMAPIPGGDPAAFVQSHVRRLEALRRSGVVTRLSEDVWEIPPDFSQRAQDYDTRRSRQLGLRTLCSVDLETQVSANGATWLDRQLVTRDPAPIQDAGFGHDALDALSRRRQWLIEEGLAWKHGDQVQFRGNLLTTLSQRELAERGEELARREGGSFRMAEDGDRIKGRYRGAIELVSGKYALIEAPGREFTLVPWRPVIEHDLGHSVSGIMHGDGISWELGRNISLGMGL
jgi:type IV secretory pathway VirD2 relaxase